MIATCFICQTSGKLPATANPCFIRNNDRLLKLFDIVNVMQRLNQHRPI